MDSGEAKRKAKRKEVAYEIKVRFGGQVSYAIVVVKDISALGMRVIVPRLIKAGEALEISMLINGRNIQCKGKVAWALLLRPAMGNIPSFDVGIEFEDMPAGDKEFLEKLTGQS
jgi:PilZ domain